MIIENPEELIIERTIAGMVEMRKTTPVTPVARRAMVPPVRPSDWKTFEA